MCPTMGMFSRISTSFEFAAPIFFECPVTVDEAGEGHMRSISRQEARGVREARAVRGVPGCGVRECEARLLAHLLCGRRCAFGPCNQAIETKRADCDHIDNHVPATRVCNILHTEGEFQGAVIRYCEAVLRTLARLTLKR